MRWAQNQTTHNIISVTINTTAGEGNRKECD